MAGELISGVSWLSNEMTEMSCRVKTRRRGKHSVRADSARNQSSFCRREKKEREKRARSTRPCGRATTSLRRPRTRTGPRPVRARSRCTILRSCTLCARGGRHNTDSISSLALSLRRPGESESVWAGRTVRVPHLGEELHLGRSEREIGRESHDRAQEGALVQRIGRAVPTQACVSLC